MAWSALCKAELAALSRSWVLRGWLVVLAFAQLVITMTAVGAARVVPVPASSFLAGSLSALMFAWSVVVIVISAASVGHDADVVSDSILSRACTRTQYIAAKQAALVAVVVGVYLVSSGIAAFVAWRYTANDMTLGSVAIALAIVGLALLLLVAVAVATTVVANNTLFAVIGLVLLCYVAPSVFSFLGADYLSPVSLAHNLPTILKDANAPQVVDITATPTTLTLLYSKDVDPDRAERPESYAIECPAGQPVQAATAAYDPQRTSVVLGGLSLPAGETVKVTVRDVTDRGGSTVSPAADSATATVAAAKTAAPASGTTPVPTGQSAAAPAGTPATTNGTPAVTTPRPAAKPAARGPVRRLAARLAGSAGDRPRVLSCQATTSSLKVVFSRDLDPADAEKVDNYIVESPVGKTHTPRAASYVPATHTAVLSGLAFEKGVPVKVTVKDVRDTGGARIAEAGSSATWSDVTAWHYVLGFGIPTILAGLLALVWFSKRDL